MMIVARIGEVEMPRDGGDCGWCHTGVHAQYDKKSRLWWQKFTTRPSKPDTRCMWSIKQIHSAKSCN